MSNFADEHHLVVHNNLPSLRWKIRRMRTARDKKLRRMNEQHDLICDQIKNLGYRKLDTPIQQGYKRLFVLTEDTKYNKKVAFYENILDKINTIWYSPHKTFKGKKRKIGKWKYRQRNEQKLQEPDTCDFHRAERFTEEEKKYFHRVDYYDYRIERQDTKYVFSEQFRFVLRVRPNIITEVQIRDSELEKHRDELSDYLDRYKNRARLIKMRGGYLYSWKKVIHKKEDRKRYAYNSFENKPFHVVLAEYQEEKELIWKESLN